MKPTDILLVALICVNISLASVALILYVGSAEPAATAATSMRFGDYLMVTGPITTGREAVLIIDVVAQRANLYVPTAGKTTGGHTFEFKSTRDLAADFGNR